MKSYFSKYANSTLFLKVPSIGFVEIDSLTGNEYPTEKIVKFTALLKNTASSIQYAEGQNINVVNVEGYLVDPMLFPKDIKTPFECEAIINNVSGILRVPLLFSSPFNVQKFTGEKIQGTFTKSS
jgi:hypothetical protein